MYYIEDYCVASKGITPLKNEDNIFVNGMSIVSNNNGLSNYKIHRNLANKKLCYAVFDGIGGLEKGDYASLIGVQTLTNLHNKKTLKDILIKINKTLYQIKKDKNINLGTVGSIIKIEKKQLIINQVGDCPIYILHDNKFSKYIDEESNSNLLDNYLGKDENIRIKEEKITLKKNDKIIICSDGLSKEVGDLEIEYILSSSNDINYITNKLLNYALMNGGKDNISIITLMVKKSYRELIYYGLYVLFILLIIFGILKIW